MSPHVTLSCRSQVYVSEVSFAAGSEGLAYTYLPLPPRSCVFDPSLLSHSISLSLLPLVEDGYVLTIADQVMHVPLSHLQMMMCDPWPHPEYYIVSSTEIWCC